MEALQLGLDLYEGKAQAVVGVLNREYRVHSNTQVS